MYKLFRAAITLVWILLMLLTGLSYWVGEGGAHTTVTLVTVIVMTIAFVKCFLVGTYFMELRHSPLGLHLVLLMWCLVGWTGILGVYLLG